jgi:hypothetical protein
VLHRGGAPKVKIFVGEGRGGCLAQLSDVVVLIKLTVDHSDSY